MNGKYYQLDNVPLLPSAQGEVPIIIGGGGKKKTPTLAGKYSEEFIFNFILMMICISTLSPFLLIIKPFKIWKSLNFCYKLVMLYHYLSS